MSGRIDETVLLDWTELGGAGMPVLCVHGFSHDRSVWIGLARALEHEARVIAPDLRGHGRSPWSPTGRYDLADYARDLPRLLDALELDRVHVVGHSLGGNVATLFAADHPARVASLVLVDTGPALERAGSLHIAGEVDAAFGSLASPAEQRARLAAIHPEGDGGILDALAQSSLASRLDGRFEPALDPGVIGGGPSPADLERIEAQLWSALASLVCPVLVVRGGRSAVLAEAVARRMVGEVLRAGRLVTLPAAGHAVMIDDGAGLTRVIRDFLAEQPRLGAEAASRAPAPGIRETPVREESRWRRSSSYPSAGR